MGKKIIDVSVSVTHDLSVDAVFLDAQIERERDYGAECNIRRYPDITQATLLRLQRAQLALTARGLAE